MNWEKIMEQNPIAIEKVRRDYVLNNMVIRDDIFGILEKHCTVVYYPIENEINCGFHTKRFVKDRLGDFVYINTAKPVAEQVFAAVHELGHVWGPQVIPYNEFQKDAEKHYDISERDRSDFKSYEKTRCYINYKGSMERKAYWLKTGLREAYRTKGKGRLYHELFCLY